MPKCLYNDWRYNREILELIIESFYLARCAVEPFYPVYA
jgi:hypothetical protein